MGKTFIIADLRLYDEEQKKKLGFNTFEQMNNYIIRAWNKTVNEDDQVILMGDSGSGTLEQMKEVFSQLNGEFTITSKHLNEKFSKQEWREIGIKFFWEVSMFNTYPDGREALYVIKPIQNIELYRPTYALLVVDSENPIEGELPFKDIMLSADALRWSYSPLDTDELFTLYDNMKQFAEMENTESRSEIKEEGEE